jgi:uncharacterized protein YdcH (DUF465 family)|tara:strand:+ start:189 stop:368 length:180 start_codon:yes stop_codon:yes gene_type:complete
MDNKKRLEEQHTRLNEATTKLEKELMYDPFCNTTMEKYTELKKKKLLVKDELFALETKC